MRDTENQQYVLCWAKIFVYLIVGVLKDVWKLCFYQPFKPLLTLRAEALGDLSRKIEGPLLAR